MLPLNDQIVEIHVYGMEWSLNLLEIAVKYYTFTTLMKKTMGNAVQNTQKQIGWSLLEYFLS